MKRLRSTDDLDSYNEKDSNPGRSSRSFYYKSDNVRKGLLSSSSSSSRYDRDRSLEDDSRENSRLVRKRSDYDFESFDRRKGLGLGFDRYSSREGYGGGGGSGGGCSNDRSIRRSESFSGQRREFPKGFRSERDRPRREGSVSSWRRFGSGSKELEESRGSKGGNEERMNTTRSSPKGLRDVKSPTWSRDSGSEQTRVVRGGGRDEGKGRSSNSKSKSSPTWSKDSGSEQSKSVGVGKKSEVEAKSVETESKSIESSSSSEMEEGELEPEPELVPQETEEDEKTQQDVDVEVGTDGRGVGEMHVKDQVKEENEHNDANSSGVNNVMKEGNKVSDCEEKSNDKASASEDEVGNMGGDDEEDNDNEGQSFKEESKVGENNDMVVQNSVYSEEMNHREKAIDLEEKVEADEVPESNNEVTGDNGGFKVNMDMETESLGQILKDKGKSVAISPSHYTNSAEEDCALFERKSKNVVSCRNEEDDMEGPSTRGFELFTSSPVRRLEKVEQLNGTKMEDEKLMMEPLDLSLSLPNVLLPIGANRDTTQAPGSPSHGRSFQSLSTFRTNSDGFTASVSFSGSQSFFHNPSCSLTQNSLDMDNFEQSVHSRPIFQAVDRACQDQVQNDSKVKDVPLYPRILMNGNGSLHTSQALEGMPNGQALQASSKMSNGFERQLSFHKQVSGGQARNHDDSVGSHEIGPSYSFEKKRAVREKHSSSLYRSNSRKEQEPFSIGGRDFVESAIDRIISEPVHVMARKFHEMTAQSESCLKESIREIMLNADKHVQLAAYQGALQNRSDLTLDMLLKAHRCQLEILVALKTGLSDYLQVDNSISSSDLAEVFLNLRCRNLTCRNSLLVDECDCKVCAKKNGFCSACMCLVCSKFDMASNTCSWVGCDVCPHWCHADCALRESYVRNGNSATGSQGNIEMQFHCVACDHPSEMFGFVKEVFLNFAKDWTAETFYKELGYVKRIFSASKDLRGRRLHEIADQMLSKLANKSNLPEVYNHMMGFLAESDSSKYANTSVFSGKEQGSGSCGGVAGPSQDAKWLKSFTEKAPALERSASLLPSFHTDLSDKRSVESELYRTAHKEPVFDELESIVRIKQAEAKMFQARADDARREADGLKRIAMAKNEKIKEEYASRITNLRLVEAEEMRKQKFEEFQALERAHQEYSSMKLRMQTDIKDLLLKMEATKRNFAM